MRNNRWINLVLVALAWPLILNCVASDDSLNPTNLQRLLEKAYELQRSGGRDSALRAAQIFRAIAKVIPAEGSDAAQIQVSLGAALERGGDIQGCVDAVKTGLEMRETAETWYQLGRCQDGIGEIRDARKSYKQAIELDVTGETTAVAWTRLASIKKFSKGDPDQAAMIADLGQAGKSAKYLHFAIGKSFEDVGNYTQAFKHFAKGKRMLCDKPWDATFAKREVDQLVSSFPAGSGSPDPVLDQTPILIVGLPRSGSTLLEQILASHSKVAMGGEDTAFAPTVGRLLLTIGHAHTEQAKTKLIREHALLYLREMRKRHGNVYRWTDKMLANYRNLGFLRMMLPQAKVLHIIRNPVDVCLSIFKQPLEMGHHPYACSLSDCAEQYVQHRRLMKHWEKVLPHQILAVHYEKLVADFDSEVQRILDFVGLDWEDVVRDFQKTKSVVVTASVAQVRQPLNRKGVERWKKYPQGELAPLFKVLKKHRYRDRESGINHQDL